MKKCFFPGLLAGLLAAMFLITPLSQVEAGTSSWKNVVAAAPSFLQQGGAFTVPVASGGTSRSHLPNSTIPHSNPQCSVDTSDPAPAECSVTQDGADQVCSAICDANQFCSAISSPNGANPFVSCSVYGIPEGQCSVFRGNTDPIGPSFCSAANFSPESIVACSVMRPAIRQFCSAVNAFTEFLNACSAVAAPPALAACSMLAGNPDQPSSCSVIYEGNKLCSAFSANSFCSVLAGQTGSCSAFAGAPLGSCSVQAPGGFCSVIGGAPGPFCVQ